MFVTLITFVSFRFLSRDTTRQCHKGRKEGREKRRDRAGTFVKKKKINKSYFRHDIV